MGDQSDRVQEQWIYGGTRIGGTGSRYRSWIGADGVERLYSTKVKATAVGDVYTVDVTRDGSGAESIGVSPRWFGRNEDDGQRALLRAAHEAAETRARMLAGERKATEDDGLSEALRPLLRIAKDLPRSQRTAFAAIVLKRIMQEW